MKKEMMGVSLFLTLAYLFFIGSTGGWVLELFFRRFISSANPERKWINPGFCIGPYLPIYGFGLCVLYLCASFGGRLQLTGSVGKVLMIVCMGLCMTAIEYVAGLINLKWSRVRLWDYSREWGNLQGIICPKFSLIWTAAGAVYYFGVHTHILEALRWLSENLAFSFVIGFFFGVFLIDVSYSAHLVSKMKSFAKENEIIIRYEALKAQIKSNQIRAKEKTHFLFAFQSAHSLAEHLKETQEAWENRVKAGVKSKQKEVVDFFHKKS